ncbi:MAG: Gfo/Idh/MocA family protein [Phycisphaerales bacterium]
MIRIGLIGLGFMGRVHLRCYTADPRAVVTAIADPNPNVLDASAERGNLADDAGLTPDQLSAIHRYDSHAALLADDSIDAVSICSPTALHVPLAIDALRAGKHVLVEKPLALSSELAMQTVHVADEHPHLVAMPAMCMRFWPAWHWLHEAIHDGRFGAVRSATFTRIGSMPRWAAFYANADESGAAILDLHIHDADFVRYCFGDPDQVESTGYSETTSGIDHIVTRYQFADGPPIVAAEGSWCMKPGFAFTMRYLVNFERATAAFNLAGTPELRVSTAENASEWEHLPTGTGYQPEIASFLDCIARKNGSEQRVSMLDGALAVRLVEAERTSALERRPVEFRSHVS